MYRLVILKLPHHSWTECCIHSYQSHHFLKVSSNWQVSLGRRLLLWQPTQTECDSYMCRVTTSKLREYRMHLLLAVVANGGRVNAYTCGLRAELQFWLCDVRCYKLTFKPAWTALEAGWTEDTNTPQPNSNPPLTVIPSCSDPFRFMW